MDKTFKHIGGRGDIIYGLPTMMLLGGGDLYIRTNPKDFVIPLLEAQPYVNKVHAFPLDEYKAFVPDYDLSKFKEYASHKYTLVKAHLIPFGLTWNLMRPWLFGIHPKPIAEIIINDTGILRWPGYTVNWSELKPYESRCAFVGHETEHKWFCENRGLNIRRQPVHDAFEFARVMKGSKLYIGNQSLGWAIAEGMKIPRVLDVAYGRLKEWPMTNNGHTELTEAIIEKYLAQWRPEHPNSPYI